MRITKKALICIAILASIMSCRETECGKAWATKQNEKISYRCNEIKNTKIDSVDDKENASLSGIGDPDMLLKFQ